MNKKIHSLALLVNLGIYGVAQAQEPTDTPVSHDDTIVVTAAEQNLQARVHTDPINISVAVPRPQHSEMLGHLDSAQTVDSWRLFTISITSWYLAPEGSFMRSHSGLACLSGTRVMGLTFTPSLMARVPCGLTNLAPGTGRRGMVGSLMV